MKEKVCLITGSTSGIGKAAAYALARLGARVLVAGRAQERCSRTVNRIKKRTRNDLVDCLVGDLSSLEQVRLLAESFHRKYQRLDVLINNAGAKFESRQQTVDGYEMSFALNHLAPFLLTHMLLGALKAPDQGRIINVSSGSHFGCSGVDFEDLQGERGYNGKLAYAQSKLALMLFTYELARRLEGTNITVNALTPGGVLTKFAKNNGLISWARHIAAHLLARNLVGPGKGAETVIYLATSPEVDGVSGKYFSNRKAVTSSNASYDLDSSKRLWQVSLELTGLTDEKNVIRAKRDL